MADGREDDREATFQFIEEVQNCPDLWGVSSAAYKDTKNKQKKGRASGETASSIQFRPNFSISPALSVSSPAINIKTHAAILRECQCTTSAMLQI